MRPLDSPATDFSSFAAASSTGTATDLYANSLFSPPPPSRSSQLSMSTTVLGSSTSSPAHKPSVHAVSSRPAANTTSHSAPSPVGGRKRPGGTTGGGGGHVWSNVDVFSPMPEEDEDGVFSSAPGSAGHPSSAGSSKRGARPAPPSMRSETPPLKFTPRRPSDPSIVGPPAATPTTPSRTAAMISQFEQRQASSSTAHTPTRTSVPASAVTPSRTPMSRLDKPLPPITPQSQARPEQKRASPSYLPAPPSPSAYAFPTSPTHRGDGLDGQKRSPLRDGIKSLVRKFGHVSPSKFRKGHRTTPSDSSFFSAGSDAGISRPTLVGQTSWARPGEGDVEILGSDVGTKGDEWSFSPAAGAGAGAGVGSPDEEQRPYVLSGSGLASPLPQVQSSSEPMVVSPRASRPLPAHPVALHSSSSRSSYPTTQPSTDSHAPILRQGPLLLFSSTSSPPHWIRTTATLRPSLLSCSFASLRGSLETVNTALAPDTIVRSVPEREAQGRWPVPFDGGDDEGDEAPEVHYLEIALSGQGSDGERTSVAVAVRNVGERLGWVGSIWDAILAGVMSPEPDGSQVLASFPAPPTSSPFSALAPPLPPLPTDAAHDERQQQDSPQDSLLTTPPLSPTHAGGVATAQFDTADIISSAVSSTNDDEGGNERAPGAASSDEAHIRRSEDSDRSVGPPQLTYQPLKPLSLPRRGSAADSAESDGLRFNVEQMFLHSGFTSYAPPPETPSPQSPTRSVPSGRKQSAVAALASAYEARSPHRAGTDGPFPRSNGGGGSWSKASSGVVRAEHGEGPTSLDNFEDHTRAARIRSQAHHRHSNSAPPDTSPSKPALDQQHQPSYFSTRPGMSPRTATMGRSRSDSLPRQSQPPLSTVPRDQALFSPNARSEYYVHDFPESDLNPSRSASQIRPKERGATAFGKPLPIPAAVQEQYADVPTPTQSILFETASENAKSGATSPAAAAATAADMSTVIQLLSAQAASSSTRGELADLKLTGMHDSLGALLHRSAGADGKLDGVLHGLRGVEDGMKEVTLGVAGTESERAALQATVDEVNEKLSAVLALCERFGASSNGSRNDTPFALDDPASREPSETDDASSTPRRKPPPVLPIVGLPGGAGGRLPDEAFENRTAPSSKKALQAGSEGRPAALEATPDTNAATEDAPHGATIPSTLPPADATDLDGKVAEVLQLVRTQQAGRSAQDQQTSDIARYLNELNRWMEEFVRNGHSSVDALADRVAHLQDLIQPPPFATPRLGDDPASTQQQQAQPGVVGELKALREMVGEMRDKQTAASPPPADMAGTQQRLEALLASVEMERHRYQQQNSSIDSVLGQLDRQRLENQELLKAMVHDLKGEIQGERIRFVDAMRSATQINVEQHLSKFKEQLSAEVARSLNDLHRMREEKKVLEGQIAELFAFKVKNGMTANAGVAAAARRPSHPVGGASGSSPFPPSPSVPLPPLPTQTHTPYHQ